MASRHRPALASRIATCVLWASSLLSAADPCALVLAPEVDSTGSGGDSRGAGARLDREILRLQEAVRRGRDRAAWLERLGWAFVAKARSSRDPGYYTLAEQCTLCIESERPQSPVALLLRGHVLHSLHRFREAERIAQRLAGERGLWCDHSLLGDALLDQGRLAEAAAAYQRMMDLHPGPEAYLRAAQVRWLKGDLEGAIDLTARACRATDPRDPENAAWAHARLARLAFEARRARRPADRRALSRDAGTQRGEGALPRGRGARVASRRLHARRRRLGVPRRFPPRATWTRR